VRAALLVLLPGCLAPTWGVLPGDGFHAVSPEQTILLDAGVSLADAPPLAPIITLTEDGSPVPVDVRWSRDAPAHLRVVPEAPLTAETVFTLRIGEPAVGPHDADPRVRTLPTARTVTFSTASAAQPTSLFAARCGTCPGADGGSNCGIVLTDQPVSGVEVRLVGRPDLPLDIPWIRDADQPRLWTTVDDLPDASEGPTEYRLRGEAWAPLPCDPSETERALDAAFGRSRLE